MNPDEPLDVRRPRGRKPAAAMEVVAIDANSASLSPPSRLSAEEATVWRESVASVKAGWFRGSETVLETFCRAVIVERRLGLRLRDLDPADERFAVLARMHRNEAMLVGNLAGKLRLTVRATRDRETIKRAPTASFYDIMALGDPDGQN